MDVGERFEFTLRPESEGKTEFTARWRDLAAAARHPEGVPSGASLAAHLAAHPRAEELTAAVLGVVRAALEVPAGPTGDEPRQQASQLLAGLPSDLIGSALRWEPDESVRRRLLETAIAALPFAALPKLTMAALDAHGRSASPALFGMLDRLRSQAASLPAPHGAAAADALRAVIGRALALACADDLRSAAQGFMEAPASRSTGSPFDVEPERTLAIALVANATGDVVWHALTALLEQDRHPAVLAMLRAAPRGEAADQIARRVATPRRLTWLLRREPLDVEALDVMLRVMGGTAAQPLVEELCESGSRQVRRVLLDRLAGLGERVPALASARLRDRRWYVVRNMLALLRQASAAVDAVQVEPLLTHTDARVRREAMMLLATDARTRDAAIVAGLRDEDRNVVRAALQAARSGLPDAGVPVLAGRLTDGAFAPEQRVLALHLLGRSRNALALEALLHWAGGGRSLLGRPKLAPKSAEMLAALTGLARSWSSERRAAALLEAASRSRDPQVRAALGARAASDAPPAVAR